MLISEEIPQNGRLDKYLKGFLPILRHLENCSKPLKQTDTENLELFMCRVFDDCMVFLKRALGVAFPNITLTIIYKAEEYADLCKALNKMFGPKPYSKAVIVGSGSGATIYIDFEGHFKRKPIDFIANICVSYLEELVHSAHPKKSETEIQELVCSVVEGFLEIKLPDKVKKERLRQARIYNGH